MRRARATRKRHCRCHTNAVRNASLYTLSQAPCTNSRSIPSERILTASLGTVLQTCSGRPEARRCSGFQRAGAGQGDGAEEREDTDAEDESRSAVSGRVQL